MPNSRALTPIAVASLVLVAVTIRTAGAQKPERLHEVHAPGPGIPLKAGWQLLFHDGCRFAVPGSWRPDADGGLVSAPGGSNLSVRAFKIANWSAHKTKMRATFGQVKVLHEDSDRRLWVEVGDSESSQHFIDVASGQRVCIGLLEIRGATTPDAADTTNRIADSIGPAPDTWPPASK